MQPLQTLSSIPSLQLSVEWVGLIEDVDHPCITQWLKHYGQLISHLTVRVDVSENWLKLRDFSDAAAPCKSIDLTLGHFPSEGVDLSDLEPLAGSLHSLICRPGYMESDSLRGASALSSMSHLTALHLTNEDLGRQEPWGLLAKLTSLQQLSLNVSANGDPSPLSALTGLTYMSIDSVKLEEDGPTPFSFSSLQPLSTLQQLEVLQLGCYACAATSLQGLAGLSNLLRLTVAGYGVKLRSLVGISPRVIDVSIKVAPNLVSLAGIEGCTSMEKLSLMHNSGVSCLQPLKGLSSLKELVVYECALTSLEGLNGLSLQSLSLTYCSSLSHLSGVEHLSALRSLLLEYCGVTSLQPLSQLGEGLQRLTVVSCLKVQERVLKLPYVQPTAVVSVGESNVREVVRGGG
jgi:Leucine-rich repeat (LRR) protein